MEVRPLELYGDAETGDECFSFGYSCGNSMTAIAKIYTPDGFTVAADGRELHIVSGHIASEETQKIVRLYHTSGEMICAVAGVSRLVFGSTSVDIVNELSHAAVDIATKEVRNPDEYSGMLRDYVCRRVASFRPSFLASARETETHIDLDGYILGHPMRRKITLTYRSDRIEGDVSSGELFPGGAVGRGSEIVWSILFGPIGDSRLQSYRSVCQSRRPATISQSIEVCYSLIRAHCDPEAMSIDKTHCESIGGHIHIATVTPTAGFQWVPGYEPVPRKT
jgi:hypothetical protein